MSSSRTSSGARSCPVLSIKVLSFGAWGPGFENCQDLSRLLDQSPNANLVAQEPSAGDIQKPSAGGNQEPSAGMKKAAGPKPEVIPANERRRAPLPVRLAVESSLQATKAAGIDPKVLSCVFVSGFGDTQLTDYMCKALATESKQLSPTKFHNSVHNAAAGYWTISAGCERAANSVAGFQESVPLALMDAVVQCSQEAVPILITFYDAPVSDVLTDILGSGSAFSFSMIIAPVQSHYQGRQLDVRVLTEQSDWPELLCQYAPLKQLYVSSPAGRILAFYEKFFKPSLSVVKSAGPKKKDHTLLLPLGTGTSLWLEIVND